MSKGYAQRLDASCINKGLINDAPSGLTFLKTVNYHIVYSSPNCGQPLDGGFYACGSNPQLLPRIVPYTEQYPINYVAPSGSMCPSFAYGKNDGNVATTLTRLDGEPVYFSAGDYNPWKPVSPCPPPYNITTRQGPAFPIQTAFGSMLRKDPTTGNYGNRLEYDFLDSSYSMPDPERNQYLCEKGDKRCPTFKWLTFSGTGNDVVLPMYTSCPEPFTIETHYEQSGSPAPFSPLGQNYLPFCAPINARLEDGTVIGRYTGLSYSIIFGQCVLSYGAFPQYLPQDPWNPSLPPKPPVDAHKAFYSVELSTFFRGVTTDQNYPLGSPLICKQRYWLYSGVSTPNWRYPFKFMCADSIYASNPFKIAFTVIGDGPKELVLNLTNQKILITY